MLFQRCDGKTFQIDLMDGVSTYEYIATDTSPDIMFGDAVDPFVTLALLHDSTVVTNVSDSKFFYDYYSLG